MMHYQVGGSLSRYVLTYVKRQADDALETALHRSEFCYILDSRQMGKSSLLVRAKAQMEAKGSVCTTLDLTNFGSRGVSAEQWYQGIGVELCLGLNLLETRAFLTWWQEQGTLPDLQKLSRLIDEVLLPKYPQTPIYIFVDEVDSVLSLDFAADDWFALIRYCYNQRAIDTRFHQLTFVLAGVATPSDLIADKTRTPFNVGYGIELQGLQLKDVAPLASGLVQTEGNLDALMGAILHWTGGQPFLTQKLCQLVADSASSQNGQLPTFPLVGQEDRWVEKLVEDRVINRWESQDEPEHLRTIRDRLLRNEQRAGRLLGLYQRLLVGETIATDDSREQTELLLSGLVIRQQGTLQVKNPIYEAVFNHAWVDQQFTNLRPYAEALQAWNVSGKKDQSRLLRGQALQDAQHWARGKSLDDLDYQFLAASEALDRQEAKQQMELAQAKEVEARLYQERRVGKLQQYLLGSVSIALIVSIGLGVTAFVQARRALQKEQQAEQEVVRTLTTAAHALLISDQRLDALVSAVKAMQRSRKVLSQTSSELENQVDLVLRQTLYNALEINRLTGHLGDVNAIAFSPDGQTLVSGGSGEFLRFWQRDGELLKAVPATNDEIYAIDYSPNGDRIALATGNGAVELWSAAGAKQRTLAAHTGNVWYVTFGPQGTLLASAGNDGSVKLWSQEGELLQTFQEHKDPVYGADISPDQELIASASTDGTAKLWARDGSLKTILEGHDGPVWAIAFSPDGETVVTTGQDQTVRLWQLDGTLIKTLTGHDAAIWGVTFSPDGTFLVSTSVDGTARVWSHEGFLLDTLVGHQGSVWGVDVSPNSQTIATASWDQTIRLWQRPNPLRQTIHEPEDSVTAVAFTSTGDRFVSASLDGAVQLWSRDGKLLKTLGYHDVETWSVAISPDDTYLVSGGADKTARVWSLDGQLLHVLQGHDDNVYALDISPNSETIATSSLDGIVKLWRRDGTLQQTLETGQTSVYGLAFSPDGQTFVTGGNDKPLRFWNLAGQLVHDVEHDTTIVAVAFSPDGQTLVTADEATVQLRQSNGHIIHTFTPERAETTFSSNVDFSPNGDTLALTLWNNYLKSWQISLLRTDGTEINTLFSHQGEIRSVAFSPDGRTLASGSFDKTIDLWNLEQILELDEPMFACAWIADYLRTSSEVDESDSTLCDS